MGGAAILALRRFKAEGGWSGGRADLYVGTLLVVLGFNLAGMFEDNWGDTEVQRLVLFVLAIPHCLPMRSERDSRGDGVSGPGAFRSYLAAARVAVDGELKRLLPAADEPPARLHEAMRYGVLAGGKRLRPALCLLAGELYGADRARLLPGAAALEMIHTFSLVHDDLPALDDDDLRRGQPTVHRRYDEATALLVGDGLADAGVDGPGLGAAGDGRRAPLQAARVVGHAVGTLGMIGGQMADLEAERVWPAEARAALESIHRRKTGDLIVASMRIGGIYAGAGEEADRLLTALAERLGLMFQISDDILDVEGSDETLGKTAGKDARAHKLTYPALLGVAAEPATARAHRRRGRGSRRRAARRGRCGALADRFRGYPKSSLQ